MTDRSASQPMGSDGRPGHADRRLQGHWLLAKMGKRVLRPGGLEMTRVLLREANPTALDRIVEFGPGVGTTAQALLAAQPRSYTGVDPNPEGTSALDKVMRPYPQARRVVADAAATGLEDECADLVVGEAMLTMQPQRDKETIVAEAFRLLSPGGRYMIHELGFTPDTVGAEVVAEVSKELSRTIKVGARPLTVADWTALLEGAGFEVTFTWTNSMALLEPRRLIRDEGLLGFARFAWNVARHREARRRIRAMRAVFVRNRDHINAVGLVATKPRN